MARVKGQFQGLLGQTIVSLARVALQGSELSPLCDTLLFSLADQRTFELLVEQETIRFEEVATTHNLFAGFELEPTEQLVIYPLDAIAGIPQTVTSLTEIWAGQGEHEFLIAISFWNQDQRHIISVCTEGDEAEIMNLEAVRQRLDDAMFSYGSLSHHLYTCTKAMKNVAVA